MWAAQKGAALTEKEVIRTDAAPAPFQGAPYSQAIKAGGLVFVSGQLSLAAGESELRAGTIQAQTNQVFANLRAILEKRGAGSTGWSRRRCSSRTSTTSRG